LGVRRAAQGKKDLKFTALMHHIDIELLRHSYFKLKRDAASGVDGVDWASYGERLNERLELLHKSVHRGSYRAQPARRVYIPKADGSLRPLSILCIEDKIVQQAVVEVLQAIFEPDFMGFSYGFRPERGQHDALDALQTALYRKQVNWILDADIRKFFDSMDHTWMLRFLQHRIGDRRLLRLIRKWLKVGIMEEGSRVVQEIGAPQGAVVSPILANVYLHYVFDLWVHHWRRRNAKGDVIVIRYADDTVLGFQYKQDADALLEALGSRLSDFGLALHPDKTRLLEFGRYAQERRAKAGKGKPETFDFLGFTHYCSRARKNGWFKVERKTIAKRMRAQLQVIKTELRRRLHRPIDEIGCWINQVLRGHMAYYAVPGNGPSIASFVYRVEWLWLRSLCRRSQRRRMNWERFRIILNRYVPRVRIMHPQPLHRFDAKHTREEPSALGAHAGICAGGAG
jgi:group II intron reverse transcriptase/maturase